MDIKKKKLKGYIALTALLILCIATASAMTFFAPNKDVEAIKSENISSQATDLGNLLLTDYKTRTDGKVFNGDVLWDLISRISGGSVTSTSPSELNSLGSSVRTSADFRSNNNRLGNGTKDVVVTIDGKKWIATYLSKTTTNAPILTLWLANSDCVNADGSSYNSTWSAGYQDYTNDWVNQYLGNLYGTSYMRAVTLNNGGDYADTDSHMTTNLPKSQTSPWAIFTVPNTTSGMNGSLTDFIEVPNNVSWQLNQTAKGTVTSSAYTGSYNFNNNNDALNAGGNGETGDYLTELNKNNLGNYYKAWGTDTLWLPSVTETGVNGVEGIWKASDSTRENSTITWLRSAYCGFYYRAYRLNPAGNGLDSMYVSYGFAVRPAFHLNLEKVANAATAPTPTQKKTQDYYNNGSDVPFVLEKVDANKVDTSNIHITAKDMNGNTISSPSYTVNSGVLTFNAQTVGEYTVEVEPKSGEIWADGSDKKLTFTYLLKYHVAPFDVRGQLTQPYNGKVQYFEVDNYDSTKMSVTTSTGSEFIKIPTGLPHAGNWAIAATNASTTPYSVRVDLLDTKFMEWDETPTNSSFKVFDIKIEQKTLNIQTSQIWSTSAYTSATFDLDINCCDEDIGKLQFVGSYIAPDGTTNPINGSDVPVTSSTDKKVTVTIPSTLSAATQNYKYVLELKSGVAANNNYKMSTQNTVNFSVGNKQINLTDADIRWRYANQDSTGGSFVNIGASDLDSQGVFNVEYNTNKQPYFLDVDLNQTLGSDLSKLDYSLTGVQETDAGNYTATFTIKVKNGISGVVIPQGKDTFTLKWRINKAKLDLSSVAWDYTTPLPFNNKTQTVSLILPAGLSATYLSSSNQGKSVSNAYNAVVTAITITDPDMNKNYHTPTVGGNGTTYIYNGSESDLPWTLSWEICVGPLDLEWEAVDIYTDGNGRKFKYAQVKSDFKMYISGYEYYTYAEYNNGNPTVSPRTLDDIEVVAGQADTYYAVAILDSAMWGSSYYITPTSQAKDFTVGSTKTEIFIEMTQRNHTYDGQKFGDGWQIKQGSSPINRNVIIDEYYSIASDGTRTLLTDGVPKDAGKYVVVFNFRDPDDANEYEIVIEEIEFEIEQAEIEIALNKNEYTYDGQGKGGEFVVTTGNYNVSDLVKTYYKGNTKDFPLSAGELPCDTGKYIVELSLPTADANNYKIKSGCEEFEFDIIKAKIVAKWVNGDNNIPIISGLDGKLKEIVGYIYYDEDGNQLEDGATLEIGKSYKVKAILLGDNAKNYEFVTEDGQATPNDSAETEQESFTLTVGNNGGSLGGVTGGDGQDPNEPPASGIDFGNIGEKLKQLWQVIASAISIVLIIAFTAKGLDYASKKKENERLIDSKYSAYAVGLFGITMTNWTIIACILMGVAVLSFIFMLLEKSGYKKSQRALDDAKEEYARNKEEMMYMRMTGGMNVGMGGQGYGYAQPQFAIEDMRGMINEAMSNMLPNVTQYLPQQASVNDELVQQLIDQNARNEEVIRNMAQEHEMLMQKFAEQQKESVDEGVIEKLVEKLAKQQVTEHESEKEVASAVVNEKTIEELKETIREEIQTQMTAKAEKVEKDEKDEKIEMLLKANENLMHNQEILMEKLANQEKALAEKMTVTTNASSSEKSSIEMERLRLNQEMLMHRINDLAMNTALNRQQFVPIMQQPTERIIEKPVEKIVEKEFKVEVPVEKIVEKEVVKEVPVEVEKIVEVEKVVPMPVEKPAPKAKKAPAPRLTLDEAYAKLSDKQKKIFDTLKAYALTKDMCKEKKSTYFIVLGQSTVNPLVKLTIKKNTTVALFKMEDEYMKDIRKNATSDGTKVKVKETELIVGDNQALSTAKEMIDLREDQIERYNDYLKEQKSMRKK